MPIYLVETFLSHGAAGDRHARERAANSAADALTRDGTLVRFGGSIYVPDDEICFFWFDAPSGGSVELAAERAGLRPLRVVEAISSTKETLRPCASETSSSP